MSWLTEQWRRLEMLLRGEKFVAELDEEMRLHRYLRERELQQSGVPREQAAFAANRAFGNVSVLREKSRDRWGWRWLLDFLKDARLGARTLRKSPGFTAVAILTLGIGIGANTALFSAVNAVVLRALPFADAKRMVSVRLSTSLFPTFRLGLSWPAFENVRERADALEQAFAYSSSEKTVTSAGEPALVSVSEVSDGFFEALGTRAQLGRLLSDADQSPGQDHVAVLSDTFWREHFGAAPYVVGRSLTVDDQLYTIVGVAPSHFGYPDKTEIWTPLALSPALRHEQAFFALSVNAKLRKGQTLARAQEQLKGLAAELSRQAPEIGKDLALPVAMLSEEQTRGSRRSYLVLFCAASFVLLIACANLASMLLARGLTRGREMALRAALGASAWRLLRQNLAESLLLALLGCALGVGIGFWGIRVFQVVAPPDTARLNEIAIDHTVLWFAVGVSLLAGTLLGLVPGLRAARTAPGEVIKQGTSAGLDQTVRASRFRFGSGLVGLEVALAFVLLVGSLLMTRTLRNALHQSTGFRTDHLLSFDLPTRRPIDPDLDKQVMKKEAERIQRILERVRTVAGVEQTAGTDAALLRGTMMMHAGLQVLGAVPAEPGIERSAHARYVSPGYFRMMQIPLLRGREFSDRDVQGAPIGVVVNETMARQYWSTLDVLGRKISFGTDDKSNKPEWDEVIGVVADIRDVRVTSNPQPQYFLCMLQGGRGSYHLLVRTRLEPQALAKSISQVIWAEFPDQAITHVSTMTQQIAASLGNERLSAVLLDTFAGIGLLLALIGVYGVIAFRVARRTQEVGIRMAVGAAPHQILRMVLRQGMVPVVVGTVVGIAGALGMGRLISSQLYGVKSSDPPTFAGAIVLLALVAAFACYLPARRATKVDPVVALRYE